MDLLRFTRERPDVDLTPHLAKTSLQFQNYIQRSLMQVCMTHLLAEQQTLIQHMQGADLSHGPLTWPRATTGGAALSVQGAATELAALRHKVRT